MAALPVSVAALAEMSWLQYNAQRSGPLFGVFALLAMIIALMLLGQWWAARTVQRQIERQLAEAKEELQSFFDNFQDVLARIDAEDRLHFITPSVEKVFGYRTEEVVGRIGKEFQNPRWVNAERVLQTILERGYVEDEEAIMTHRDGHPIYCSVSARLLPDGGSEGVFRDISERKRAEMALQEAKEQAEAANADKSRFLAAASHDLRQPLHAMNLYLGAIANETDEQARGHLLQQVRETSRMLGELLNALLDISRLDAGTITPEFGAVSLGLLMNELATEFRPQVEAKGLTLRVHDCSHTLVHSDPMLLGRMLRNMLSNAVRYTEAGGVLFACRKAGAKVQVGVWDTGCGIPEDELERVFLEFYQLHNPERDRGKGQGLGLSIVQRLSALLDHPLRVRSRPQRGSCFSVELPVSSGNADAECETLPWSSDSSLSGKFVLVVDDDRTILDAMRAWLRGWECEALLSEGREALQEELSRYDYPAPDAIVADYRLRDHYTGLDVVRDVREYFGREIPAVIISGDTSGDIARLTRQAGCLYLPKPAGEGDVLKALAGLVGGVD